MALVIFLGIPFTLYWWKQADKWEAAEHRRFKVKVDEREKVVIRDDGGASERAVTPVLEGTERNAR